MYRPIVLFVLLLCISANIFASVQTVAVVNGELISSLDVEKRASSIRYFNTKIDQDKSYKQALQDLIDEALLEDQAKKLRITINNNELNDAISLFLTELKLSHNEFSKQVKDSNVSYDTIIKQIKSQLLWDKIITLKVVPFINISNEEVSNIEQQIDKSNVVLNILKVSIPNKSDDSYNIAVDLTKELRNEEFENVVENFTRSTVSIQKEILNITQLPLKLQKILENLSIGDISDPVAIDNMYLIVKVTDKIKLDPSLTNTILNLKQIYLPSSQFEEYYKKLSDLKSQKVDCLTFNKAAEDLGLPEVEEIEIKMRELAPSIQASVQKLQIGEMIDIIKDDKGNLRLIMLCNIQKKYFNQHEWIKQKIYEQKVVMQSNTYFDNMRKNATIEVHNQE